MFSLPLCLATFQLGHLFRDSRLFWPGTASFRSCLSLPPCFLDMREALAQKAVRASPFSHLSIFLFLLIFVRSFRQAPSKLSSSGAEMQRICNYGISHISWAYTVSERLFLVHLGALENHDVLLRCVWFHCSSTTNRRTSSRLVRCVTFACAPMRFTFSHLHLLDRSLSHDRLGMPMEDILDTCG